MQEKKELFGWFSSDRKFTKEEVQDLLERVKEFNAGCIDEHLSKHVDVAFEAWAKDHTDK